MLAIIAAKPSSVQIAELMSDPAAAKLLREAATRHFAEVSELGKWDESRQA
jgi:hypothetical protein